MEVSTTISFVIGLAILAIVAANILPYQLNTLALTTLESGSANALWLLLPLLLVVGVIAYASN